MNLDHNIGKYIEPMIWDYNTKENFSLQPGTIS
jgi:hypothetical protein